MASTSTSPLASLKRILRSIFKRGKDKQGDKGPSEQQQSRQQKSTASPQGATQTHQTRQAAQDKPAPQLPPVEGNSPLSSVGASDHDKPLPPTHPLSTGRHDDPQMAIPQDRSKTLSSAPAPQVAGGPEGAERMKDQEAGQVSPSVSALAPTEGARDDAVSAMDSETTPPAVPSKIHTAANEQAEQDLDQDEDQTLHTTITAQRLDPATSGMKEDAQSNGHAQRDMPSSQPTPPATAEQANRQTQPPSSEGAPNPSISTEDEGKIAVMSDEPPPIKAVKAAPGMSATSGPLEDFPEGGDMRFD